MITYIPSGVCSKEITFDIIDNIVKNIEFTGGCSGNLQAISKLLEGKNADEIIKMLKGIQCKKRGTSCPDQLAKAIESALNQ